MEYWARRNKERIEVWQGKADELLREAKSYYESTFKDIEREIAAMYGRYARENGLTLLEARRRIRDGEYKRWRKELSEYVKDNRYLEELNELASRSRINRLEQLHARTLMAVSEL